MKRARTTPRILTRRSYSITLHLLAAFSFTIATLAAPADFPTFQVPGYEHEMATLRALLWRHYPGSGPKATLWDEWVSQCSLWPATTNDPSADSMRANWQKTLSSRIVDTDGYVATHQHPSIAHQLGWPFPFYNQGRGGFGWHYSFKNTIGPNWRPHDLNKPGDWTLAGARDADLNEDGWKLELTAPHSTAIPPPRNVDTFNSPFVQLRWSATGLGNARPFFEWTTETKTNFASDQRIYFDPVDGATVHYSMIPAYRHPQWTNLITGMRLSFDNAQAGGSVTIQAFFAQYDTRHNINSQNFVRGCANYFWWTHDLDFLRGNINRMRTGLRYVMTEHHALEKKVVFTDWIGHDGRAGYRRNPDGSKTHAFGHGVGNNYWDILPFGNLDCYATIHYYDALQTMIRLEREIRVHPDWQMPLGLAAFDPDTLARHAEEVKAAGNRLFWNEKTGRFVACIDADGQAHDYGFTFLNNEAVCYGFATPAHTQSIMSWLDGQRMVDGDTAQGKDIYHWRFGPRATTKRNLDWYFWAWASPESFPFGGQVQDGGAVLGFSYHDLMARLKALGPENAWQRLQEVLRWYDDVGPTGDYRKYYDGKREGTLQGGGTAGGLGLDMEFFESAMVPQVILYGFLGFAPRAEGFKIKPRLPTDWSELTIDRICFQDVVLRIRVTRQQIEIHKTGVRREPMFVELPSGSWLATFFAEDGSRVTSGKVRAHPAYGTDELEWGDAATVRFVRAE